MRRGSRRSAASCSPGTRCACTNRRAGGGSIPWRGRSTPRRRWWRLGRGRRTCWLRWDQLPLAVKRGYHRHFRPRGNAGLARPVVDAENGYCITPMEQGIRLTTGAEFATRDAAPTPVQFDRVMPVATGLFPLGDPVEAQPWMGARLSVIVSIGSLRRLAAIPAIVAPKGRRDRPLLTFPRAPYSRRYGTRMATAPCRQLVKPGTPLRPAEPGQESSADCRPIEKLGVSQYPAPFESVTPSGTPSGVSRYNIMKLRYFYNPWTC